MNQPVRLTILGEPASKANQRKLVTFGDRPAIIKSDKARSYEKAALMQIPPSACVMLQGPVRVTMTIFYASQRPDLDESVILDVLQAKYAKGTRALLRGGVYVNDRQVREKHVYHAIDKTNPRAEIVVEPMAPQQVDLIERAPITAKRTPKPQPEIRPGADPF